MSDYHNTHWVTFYKHSVFSAPVSLAVNCRESSEFRVEYLWIHILCLGSFIPYWSDPVHVGVSSKDPSTSISVGVQLEWYGCCHGWSSLSVIESLASGWSQSRGIPCRPLSSSSIPHSFLQLLLSYPLSDPKSEVTLL
jgi:hypothetical protein